MKTGLITSDTYQNHNTGNGHPEKVDRVRVIINNFRKLDNKNLLWKKSSKFDQSLLIDTHSSKYINKVNKIINKIICKSSEKFFIVNFLVTKSKIRKKLKIGINKVNDKTNICKSLEIILDKVLVGINPPEEIVVKDKLKASKSLISTLVYIKIIIIVEKK